MDPVPIVATEPESRFLARAAAFGLRFTRLVLFVVGLGGIAAAIYTIADPLPLYSRPEDVPPFADVVARQLTFVCAGLPLVLPFGWTLGRHRWRVAGLLALLVVAPMAFEQDPVCCLIRAFACVVGYAAILVWRTLWSLRSP